LTDVAEVFEAYKVVARHLLDNPDDPEQLARQFTLLTGGGERRPSHLVLARRCASIAPQNYTAQLNLGSALLRAGKYREGLDQFLRTRGLAPKDRQWEVLRLIALAHENLGDHAQSIKFYDQALALKDDPEIRQDRALSLLDSGDLANGLFDFECKYFKPPRKVIAKSGIPRWMGEDLTGKHVVVHHEQGFGDTIQFCRFLPHIKAGKITVAMPAGLMRLIRQNFTADEFVGEEGPFDADYYCSPMSACGAMRFDYANVPGQPYIKAAPFNLPPRGKLKVGLVWRGSAGYTADVERSMSLADMSPLLEIPGLAFYSLQIGDGSKEVSNLGSGWVCRRTVTAHQGLGRHRSRRCVDGRDCLG
jgi:hypothetical protein